MGGTIILHVPFCLILEYAMGLHMSPTSEELSGADSYCFEQLEARGMLVYTLIFCL